MKGIKERFVQPYISRGDIMTADEIRSAGAYAFLYVVGAAGAGVIGWQALHNAEINPLIATTVGGIIAQAINSVGVSHGVNVTNDTVSKTAVAQIPLMAQSEARTQAGELQVADNTARITALENPPPIQTVEEKQP